jgi:hypothetical protein
VQIKTFVHNIPEVFDAMVNRAMEEGYTLTRRGPEPVGNGAVRLYAELVQLDPEPEPEAQPADPFDALRAVQAFCLSVSADDCNTDRCPLHGWCDKCEIDPTDWQLPEKEDTPA